MTLFLVLVLIVVVSLAQLGPLFVSQALYKAGALKSGSAIANISSIVSSRVQRQSLKKKNKLGGGGGGGSCTDQTRSSSLADWEHWKQAVGR